MKAMFSLLDNENAMSLLIGNNGELTEQARNHFSVDDGEKLKQLADWNNKYNSGELSQLGAIDTIKDQANDFNQNRTSGSSASAVLHGLTYGERYGDGIDASSKVSVAISDMLAGKQTHLPSSISAQNEFLSEISSVSSALSPYLTSAQQSSLNDGIENLRSNMALKDSHLIQGTQAAATMLENKKSFTDLQGSQAEQAKAQQIMVDLLNGTSSSLVDQKYNITSPSTNEARNVAFANDPSRVAKGVSDNRDRLVNNLLSLNSSVSHLLSSDDNSQIRNTIIGYDQARHGITK